MSIRPFKRQNLLRPTRQALILETPLSGHASPDFRRVPNLVILFRRLALELPVAVQPGVRENLVLWQPGDIVTFGPRYAHIGIISPVRRPDGVPLVIHNAGPWASESDVLLRWPSKVTHHFRFDFSRPALPGRDR